MADWAASAWVKIERAKKHIGDFKIAADDFIKLGPYEILPDEHSEPGQRIFRGYVRREPDPQLGAILGDAIHNLRSVLDVLVYQLALAKTGNPDIGVKFPFAGTPQDFKASELPKIKSCGQAAMDLVETLQPYPGGNHLLWGLNRRDIEEKHHVIIPVGLAVPPANWYDSIGRSRDNVLAMWFAPPRMFRVALRRPPHTLEDGAELFRVPIAPLGDDVYVHPQFTFGVAFGKGEVFEGEPIIATLYELSSLVEKITNLFAALPP